MTTKKITELTELSAAPDSTDLVAFVDSTVTKKLTIANLFAWLLATARTFTAAPVFETGAAGASPVVFRQTGGVAGTDEITIGHDGTTGRIYDPSSMALKVGVSDRITMSSGGTITLGGSLVAGSISVAEASVLQFSTGGHTARLQYSSTKAVVLNGTEGAGAQLNLFQLADIASPGTNCAGIGAEDDGGTAKVVLVDEAGNEVIPTPHPETGPPEIYRETPGVEHVIRDLNRYRDSVEWINLTAMAKAMETLTGEVFYRKETLAEFNARTGKNKTVRDWDADQAAKQAADDANRQAEIEQAAKVEADHAAHVADLAAKHEAAAAAYVTAKAEYDATWLAGMRGIKEPVAPTPLVLPEAPELPKVREARDVRKPRPAWIK